MPPIDQQQGPRPDESQREYEKRVGLYRQDLEDAEARDRQERAAAKKPAAELRQDLEDAEARERQEQGARGAQSLGAQPGPPPGAAAALADGVQLPAHLAHAAAGSLAGDDAPVDQRMDVTHTEPILTQGATGEPVTRLVKLLAAAGYASNTIVHGENAPNALDRSVMRDVERFWNDHPEAREPDELFAGRDAGIHELQGAWVGPYTWQVLYDLAGAV